MGRQPDRRRGDDRRRRRRAMDRRRRRETRRAAPMSRCSRARPPSAATTAISSGCWSASPIISRRRRRTCRGSGCGRSAPVRSCSRAARTSAASPTRTTICPVPCSRAPPRPTSSATACVPARARSCSPTTTARMRRRSPCAMPASRSPRSSTLAPKSQLIGTLPQRARALGLPIVAASAIARAHGGKRVAAVDIAPLAGGATRRLDCDLVCVSGGWNPAVHLFSQARGKLRYDETLAAFVPEPSPPMLPMLPAGAANGRFGLAAGARRRACGRARRSRTAALRRIAAPQADAERAGALRALWSVPARNRGDKRFVDLQDDVTAADIALAAREGYTSVEHLKRYTTLGMGPDQGKTSNVVGLALLAEATGRPIPDVGTTTFRPPYTPVTLGAFPGRECGAQVEPTRYSAMHDWHVEHGARFVNAGLWKRPHSYPRRGRIARRRGQSRGEERAHAGRRRRRLDAGQDRAAGQGRRGVPEPRLHQPLGHAGGGPLPLRRDAARGRHGARRRHDVAARRDALPDDDDHGERGRGDAASRASAAGRLARPRGTRRVRHRAVGGGGGVGSEGARRARASGRHRRVERGVPVPRRRRVPASAPPQARFRRGCSG